MRHAAELNRARVLTRLFMFPLVNWYLAACTCHVKCGRGPLSPCIQTLLFTPFVCVMGLSASLFRHHIQNKEEIKKAGTLADLITEAGKLRFVPYLIFHDINLPHKKSSDGPLNGQFPVKKRTRII